MFKNKADQIFFPDIDKKDRKFMSVAKRRGV